MKTWRLAATVPAVLLAACTGSTVAPEPPRPEASFDYRGGPILRPPLEGFNGNIPEQSRYELASAWEALSRGELEAARSGAETLLSIDPTLLPATVLLAQAYLAAGDPGRALELLAGPLTGRPDYTAGQLVYGRSAELTGDTVAAYGAYRGIAGLDQEAASRAGALRGRATAELGERTGTALEAGRLAAADAGLETLRLWSPDDTATVDLRRRLARARGDAEEELEATRELIAGGEPSMELLQRQAALEIESGDARAGLDLYERLAERHPQNPEIAAALAAARFRWRTKLLPDNVARLLDAASLLRGDFATLTFWLVPGVRGAAAGRTVIVSDIVEHPQRREIARVLSLGLMAPVDAAVRRFAPNDYMRRGPALAALLRMPGRIGDGAACTGGAGGPAADDMDAVCEAALRCRLITEPAGCRPQAAMSGPDATEALRRTLHLIQ